MRSAVNMLYASALGRTSLAGEQVHTSQKDERISIFSLVTAVFSNAPDEKLMNIARDVDEIPEVVEQWVEGSVHTLADPRAMGRAYRSLARADEYIGNTYRHQYYTLWRYATALMLLGVADASGGKGIHTRILPRNAGRKCRRQKNKKQSVIQCFHALLPQCSSPRRPSARKYPGHHHAPCGARS